MGKARHSSKSTGKCGASTLRQERDPSITLTCIRYQPNFRTNSDRYVASAQFSNTGRITRSFQRTWRALSTRKHSGQQGGGSSFSKQKWASRLAADFLPSGKRMHEHEEWPSPACPLACGCPDKDSFHILWCPHLADTWASIESVLLEWGRNANAAPGLIAVILLGIQQWRSPPSGTLPSFPEMPVIPPEIRMQLRVAFDAQSELGWRPLLLGFMVPNWTATQQSYFQAKNSKSSGMLLVSHLARKLWDASWDLWQARNHQRQSGLSPAQLQMLTDFHARIASHHSMGMRGLPLRYAFLFWHTLSSLMDKPLQNQLAWFEAVSGARARHCRRGGLDGRHAISDADLVQNILDGGLLRRLTRYQQCPKLTTTLRATSRHLESIPRDQDNNGRGGLLLSRILA